jgi:hypothetical protein
VPTAGCTHPLTHDVDFGPVTDAAGVVLAGAEVGVLGAGVEGAALDVGAKDGPFTDCFAEDEPHAETVERLAAHRRAAMLTVATEPATGRRCTPVKVGQSRQSLGMNC